MDEIVRLELEQRGEVLVAHVSGELDVSRAPTLGEEIAEAVSTSADGLVMDFSELEFIDSSGIAMLFGLARRLASRRQELRVVAPTGEPVARVLELVEFDRAAPILADVDGAVADIDSGH
jgi:anti-anti-sigma factor